MATLKHAFATLALSTSILCATTSVSAAPTLPAVGGATTVQLAPSFLDALNSLGVTPAAVFPGRLKARSEGVLAAFPITTGELDAGTLKAEIDHAGGLSLKAGGSVVKLTDFIVDLTTSAPVLTGLVTVNGSLLGRVPLFDLDTSKIKAGLHENVAKVSNVGVTLSKTAAGALNSVFGITALSKGLVIGTAAVRADLEESGDDYRHEE